MSAAATPPDRRSAGAPLRQLGDRVALVSAATAAALLCAGDGRRREAFRLLVGMEKGLADPNPRLRRFLEAQIERVEVALDQSGEAARAEARP